MHLADLLTHHARYRPRQLAVVFEDQRLDWAGYEARVNRLARGLLESGVSAGERVATVLPNCLELLDTYWACARIGAVAVPLSPLLRADGLRSLLGDAEPKVVIACGDSQDALSEALAASALKPQVLICDGARGSLARLVDGQAGSAPPSPVTPEHLFNVMYTSGTTGLPKGIVHTHRIRAHYAALFASAWRMDPGSVVLHTGAIVFNGAFVTLMPAFMLGCRYVLAPHFDAEAMIETIARERVTHTMMVPAQVVAMLNAPNFDPRRLDSLQMLLSLGAPLAVAHKEILEASLPGRFQELYGLTEGFVTILEREDALRKRGSVGVPPPFFEMRIEREDGSEAAVGEIGEIVGRGPILMPGYYRQPELTAGAIRDGWLYTGDLGRVDADGFLYLADRKKDMIASGGIKVYPSDIEAVIVRHPAVLEAVVFGAPDPRWGEVPVAAVTLKPGQGVAEDVLCAWINERVAAKYQRLARVQVVDALPRNVAGKVLRRELRELQQRDQATPGGG